MAMHPRMSIFILGCIAVSIFASGFAHSGDTVMTVSPDCDNDNVTASD